MGRGAKEQTPKLVDVKELRQTFEQLLQAGQVTEVRLLDATKPGATYPANYTGYFNDIDKAVAAVADFDNATGVYLILNPVDPALIARAKNRIKKSGRGDATSDNDIIGKHWLLIDCDPVKPAGISSTDEEHQAAIDRSRSVYAHLKHMGFPDPIAADSGNGAHLLYRIDLPANDDGLVQRCLQALAHQFDDDIVCIDQKVFNPSRICKLYGTRAGKGDDIPERPHRMSRILLAPTELETVVSSTLEKLAANAPVCETSTSPSPGLQPFDIPGFFHRHGIEVDGPHPYQGGTKYTFTSSPMCDHHDDGPFLIQFQNGAVSAGCHHNSCGWGWREFREKFEPASTTRTGAQSDHRSQEQAPKAPPRRKIDVPKYRRFPVAALPEPLRTFVSAAAASIGCDESYIAQPALAAFGAAVGNAFDVQIKRGWKEPAVMWTAIVGESGTCKTPAQQIAMRPVYRAQRGLFDKHAEEMECYKSDLSAYERDYADWRRGKCEGEPPEKPVEPRASRWIVSDCTMEALSSVLYDNPRGVLAVNDELAGWFSFDRYRSGAKVSADTSGWLSIFRAGPVIIDRKTGAQRTIYIPRAFVSLTGGIQPGILSRVLGSEHLDSGLAARILFAAPPRKAKKWTESEIDETIEALYGQTLEQLFSLEPGESADGEFLPRTVELSNEAKALFVEFANSHNVETAELSGELAAAWAKLEAYPARLALIFHLVSQLWNSAEDFEAPIEAGSMHSALTLIDWYKHETRRVYGLLAENDEDRERRRLIEIIEAKAGAVTTRELMRATRKFADADEAEHALDDLVKRGFGIWMTEPPTAKGGRPTRRFKLTGGAPAATSTDDVDEAQATQAPCDWHSRLTPKYDFPGLVPDSRTTTIPITAGAAPVSQDTAWL